MNIKTYRAATMQEALRTIKAELGSDAVILSTKQHPPANGRLGSKMVEVTAAIDVEATRLRASQPTPLAVRPAMSINRPLDSEGSTPFGDMLRASLQAEVAPVATARAMKAPEVKTNGRDHELNELHAELNRIREMLAARDGVGAPTPVVSKLMPYYERLMECGLDGKTARSLLSEVQEQMPSLGSDSLIGNALRRSIEARVNTSGPLLGAADGKKTVILVGPTGVGKTTTIAKLAAHYRQQQRRSVALVTLDTYRVAAVEQLRMYADLINIPMDVALTRGDAVWRISKRHDTELILVDTAGRSPGDKVGMTEVRDILSLNHRVEVHLVLSATTRERDLMQHLKHYRGVPFDRILLTKLDETCGVGGAFDLMEKTGVPLSYFSVGQRVPEDLEVATPERLAALLLADPGRMMQEQVRIGMTA